MITLMITRRKARLALLLAMVVLFTVACNDWDGMDRSGWESQYGPPTPEPMPTPQATPPGVREGDDTLWLDIWGDALAEAE